MKQQKILNKSEVIIYMQHLPSDWGVANQSDDMSAGYKLLHFLSG
jgi:hypothetical protein